MKTQIEVIATRLAIAFSEESEIPAKYKSVSKQKVEKETNIQRKFEEKISDWKKTISEIIDHFGFNMGAQYIFMKPNVPKSAKSLTDCRCFSEFNDYLRMRRDIYSCNDGELSCLVLLFGEIQKAIEFEIGLRLPKKVVLKSEDAQKLLEEKRVTIDGVELNLWQGHTFDTIQAQQGWNKVKSYAELNQMTDGQNGDITFTGAMQIPRAEAQDYAVKLGFKVHSSISRNIEYVVVGTENVSPTKIAQVKKLKEEGCAIKVISENEFLQMVIDFM